MDEVEWESLIRVLRLDPAAFPAAAQPGRDPLLALVVVLAGVSEALGQSVVLFINRVRARRFVAALATSALLHVINYALWLISILLLTYLVLPSPGPPVPEVARTLAVAYAPRLFGFLVFMPLLGPSLGVAASIWSLLALQVGLHTLFDLAPLEAAVATLAGWLLTQLSRRTVGHPLIALARALTRRAAGSDLDLDPAALATTLRPELEALAMRRRAA